MAQRSHKLVLQKGFLDSNYIPNEDLIGLFPFSKLQVRQENIVVDPMDRVLITVSIIILLLVLLLGQRVAGDPLLQVIEIPLFVGHNKSVQGFRVIVRVEVLDS